MEDQVKMPHMKMHCDEAGKWISARVDGVELPAAVAGALDEHLSACEGCSRLFSLQKRDAALLSSALRVDGGFHSELSRSISRQAELAAAPGSAPGSAPGARRAAFLGPRLRRGIAAAFLLAAGTWFLAGRLAPPGPEGSASDGSCPVSILLEEESHSVAPFPGGPNGDVGLDTRKVHRVILDSPGRPHPRVKAGSGPGGNVWMEEVRVDSKLIQPVGWTYH